MYLFATSMLNFIKKYPMSILLAIIALNLFSIAGSLRTEAKLNKQKLECLKYTGGQSDGLYKRLGLKGTTMLGYCNWVRDI